MKLSKLKKVELREIWQREDADFTNWLAKEENLKILSEEIEVDIELVGTEQNVGRFSVDILAKEEAGDRNIIIENQLEKTDHDHLGKIITYASGYDAEIIIWIVKSVRAEHHKAIDWLNEHTEEKIGFFLIKIELWQIGDSDPAPKFEIVASPNEWAKAIKTSTSGGGPSELNIKYLDFWNRFKDYALTKGHDTNRKPFPQNFYEVGIKGYSGCWISFSFPSREKKIRCSLYISNNKDLFNFLKERQIEIEKDAGKKFIWAEEKKDSLIKLEKEVDSVFDESKDEEYFSWLYDMNIMFRNVFTKYLKEYKELN